MTIPFNLEETIRTDDTSLGDAVRAAFLAGRDAERRLQITTPAAYIASLEGKVEAFRRFQYIPVGEVNPETGGYDEVTIHGRAYRPVVADPDAI